MNHSTPKPNGRLRAPYLNETIKMKTEIDTLKTAWAKYRFAKSIEEFNAAEKVLMQFHKKYGTADPGAITRILQ